MPNRAGAAPVSTHGGSCLPPGPQRAGHSARGECGIQAASDTSQVPPGRWGELRGQGTPGRAVGRERRCGEGGGAQTQGPAGGTGAGSRRGLRNRRGAASGPGTAGSTPLGLIPEWGARPAGTVGPGGPRAPLAAAPGPAARPGPRSPSPGPAAPCAGPGPESARAGRPYRSRGRLGHGPALSGPARRKSPPPRGPTQAGSGLSAGAACPPARPAVPVRGARSSLAGPRRSVRRRAAAVSARPVHTASWEPAQAREASWRQRGRTAPPAARAPNGRRPPRPAPPRGPPAPAPPETAARARAESPRDPAPHLPPAASVGTR